MATNSTDSATQASEQRYRHLFEHMPICIIVVDLTTSPAVILEVNRWAERVYGYSAAELVGNPTAQLVPEESRASAQKMLQRVQQGETVTGETTNRRRDGTTFPVRLVATLDPDDNNRMITAVRDITAERLRRSEAAAIDAERRRIAHEIHDGVAQNLAALRFRSALWSHQVDSAPPGMRAALDEMQDVLNTAIVDIRRAIFALRPVDLDALGLIPALMQLIADFGDQNQVVARLEVSGEPNTLLASYELPLFRVIQESLNNISLHAHASSVLVQLNIDTARGVTISVRDNGRGFDPNQGGPADHANHFGLRQMRERILELGGTLDICSVIGQGTELVFTLPPVTKKVNHADD